jgi:predicted NBD/HSP70 family sugar kinase
VTATHAPTALVIEVGGTTVRLTRYFPATRKSDAPVRTPTPNYLRAGEAASPPSALIRELFGSIQQLANRLLENQPPDFVVMAYPGPLSAQGVALRSPTILGPDCVETVAVKKHLADLWPYASIHVVNDLTAAGYYFVAQGYQDFCAITVGSGIGNKVFLAGRPQIGPHGFGGEIGHVKARPKPGTPVEGVERDLGEIASGRGTAWIAQQWLERDPRAGVTSILGALQFTTDDDVWSRTLARAFLQEDALATRIVEAAAYPLAHAIASLHLNLGLEKFFIVGGFARALGPRYQQLLSRLAEGTCWRLGQRWNDMIELGDESAEEGLTGACHLACTLATGSPIHSVEAA